MEVIQLLPLLPVPEASGKSKETQGQGEAAQLTPPLPTWGCRAAEGRQGS